MKIVAVIPARLASTRFPRKVLFPFHGLPMIEHVRRRAQMVEGLASVHVATCDEEVAEVVRGFGGSVVMTADTHRNGTTRVAEAVQDMDCTHVLLLQGDEPLLLPRHVESMIRAIESSAHCDAWNATGPIDNPDELDRHSFVKCAVTSRHEILYCFRRSPSQAGFETQQRYIRKVLGVMAYRKDFLLELTRLEPSLIEEVESIEQMRIVAHRRTLISVPMSPSLPSVNEPEEGDAVLEFIEADKEQSALLAMTLKNTSRS
jgi:3-deoxy-manno-octulosonate cytidylyltransferase (CMP-KDO synthetase)